jgi:Pyruvate phosphate dikinase, AMP/ATP-binding domain
MKGAVVTDGVNMGADTNKTQMQAPAAGAPKYVYRFGAGSAEGSADMRNLLGGKGANLAEMSNLGLPVPPGFTITTEVCTAYYVNGRMRSQPSARRPAPSSEIQPILFWFRCARVAGLQCRA